ncbi:MAG: hypothetical protein IJW13_03475 [Clostridia bacterium]|nr:hypothetical protein [Clostridia bacterium]
MNKEYIVNKSSEITLNITDGKVDSFREIDETTNTVRVYSEGKIGVAGALGEVDFSELEKTAETKLLEGIPYQSTLNKNLNKKIENPRLVVDKSKIIPTAKRIAKKVAMACPKFLVNGKVQLGQNSGSYKNSENTDLAYKNSNLSVFFQVKDKQSSNIADAYYGVSLGKYGKSVEDKIVADLAMLHENFFAEKILLPNGEYPMIFGSYDILGHVFKDFIAEYYVSGGSLFSGKLGQKVFNEKLSVYVDRNPKTNRASAFYDGEGEIAKNYRAPLIEKGVINGILNTKNTAAMFGLPHAKTSGGSYDGVPTIALPGLFVQSTAANLSELLGDKKAIYVAITSGGDITTEGTLGLPVMLAFLVENGKMVGRVSEFNASGNILDILGKDFVGVSKQDIFAASENEVMVVNMNLINE